MRTVTDAILYIVKGPHGPYFAVRDLQSGSVFTERTEFAAASQAHQRDMVISDRVEITHEKLLRLIATQCQNGSMGEGQVVGSGVGGELSDYEAAGGQ